MQLEITIEDKKADIFLNLLKELNNIVTEFKVLATKPTIKYVDEQEKQEILEILHNIKPKDNEIDESYTRRVSI